jgi:PPOX class probable F420-dependent enzyme
MANLDLVRQLGPASNWLAIAATTRPDGSVHASLVNAGVLDDPAGGEQVVGIVVRGDARKLAYARRAGRASVTFHNGWQWATVEGPVTIVGPDDGGEDLELLRAVFRGEGGSHDDWDEYDRVMRADRRAAILVRPERVLTNG